MLYDLLFVFSLAVIPASFSFFLDYCLGKPMSDQPSVKAIFSFYSFWMAKNRVKKMGLFNEVYKRFEPQLFEGTKAEREDAKQQFRLTIIYTGQKYFTYEQALGMCPFCTNFWVCMFTATVCFFIVPLQYINPFFFFLIIPIISHLILRKL